MPQGSFINALLRKKAVVDDVEGEAVARAATIRHIDQDLAAHSLRDGKGERGAVVRGDVGDRN